MRAVQFHGVGLPAHIVEVPRPEPGPGELLIRIGGAGVCHSDLHVLEEGLGFSGEFTLGHENAGWVAEVGARVSGFKEGDAVAVYGPWGCGHCHACQLSMENYCENWAALGGFGGGLGFDGGMADYMLVPSTRLLVPLDNLAPVNAAPLTDAALTPYHAIKRALPHLTPDVAVVVLGLGGLGHMAVQLLRVLAPVRVIAADIDWSLIRTGGLIGLFIILLDEILASTTRHMRVPPLAVGLGIYLPTQSTLMVVVGAVVGWFFDKQANRSPRPEATKQLGVLLASGLIVGESVILVVISAIVAFSGVAAPLALVGPSFETAGRIIGGVAFIVIAALLYRWIWRMATTNSAARS